MSLGPFKCYVAQMAVGGCQIFRKKRYEGVRFNVISVTRGWVGVQFPGKKRYVILEWPLSEETLKAVGPFYLVSMPGEVKHPTQGVNRQIPCVDSTALSTTPVMGCLEYT